MFEDWELEIGDLDNILEHMRLKNVFIFARLIIFGHIKFRGVDKISSIHLSNKIIESFAKRVNIPIISGHTFGHIQPTLSFRYGDRIDLIRDSSSHKIEYHLKNCSIC